MRDSGFAPTVFVAPTLPYLSDSAEQIDGLIGALGHHRQRLVVDQQQAALGGVDRAGRTPEAGSRRRVAHLDLPPAAAGVPQQHRPGGHGRPEVRHHRIEVPVFGDEARVGVGVDQREEAGVVRHFEEHRGRVAARSKGIRERRYAGWCGQGGNLTVT
ncbi:hypothetical protein [Paractinoplanes durhamensis]|nr:hypothetical protein [Actinoplanes durhamensis]